MTAFAPRIESWPAATWQAIQAGDVRRVQRQLDDPPPCAKCSHPQWCHVINQQGNGDCLARHEGRHACPCDGYQPIDDQEEASDV